MTKVRAGPLTPYAFEIHHSGTLWVFAFDIYLD